MVIVINTCRTPFNSIMEMVVLVKQAIYGLAATEWSWCPLIADLDNDGYNDVLLPMASWEPINDMDFISFIANDNIQKSL